MVEIEGTSYECVPVIEVSPRGNRGHDLLGTCFKIKETNSKICIADSSIRPYKNIKMLSTGLLYKFKKLNCRYSCYILNEYQVLVIKR